jgi:hypothetical protein
MKSLLISLVFVFISLTTFANENPSDNSKSKVIDLNPDQHSFTLDTITVSNHFKKIIFSVYRDGVKQQRKVTVIIDYSNSLFLQAADTGYNRSGYKTSRYNVKLLASVGGIVLKNLYNYSFIDQALEAAHIN